MPIGADFDGIAPIRLRLARFEGGGELLVRGVRMGRPGDGGTLRRHDEYESGRHQGGGRTGSAPWSGLHEEPFLSAKRLDNVVTESRKVK